MLHQGRSCIAPQTVLQLTWCFRKTFLLMHKFGTAWAIKMIADREEWSELPMGATTETHIRSGTSVIRRSSVPPWAWVGPTTNWSQPDTRHSCEVKGCCNTMMICGCWAKPLLMIAIQITHKQERHQPYLHMIWYEWKMKHFIAINGIIIIQINL